MDFKILTGNYTQIAKMEKEKIVPISISIFPPKYLKDISTLKIMAPNQSILKEYKNSKQNNLDRDNYITRFKKEVLKENEEEIINHITQEIIKQKKLGNEGVGLLCFESAYDFCHRQIVADFLEENQKKIKEKINDMDITNEVFEFEHEHEKRDLKNYRIVNSNKTHIALIGSRTFKNYGLLEKVVLEHLKINNISKKDLIIVSGGANGADKLGEEFANNHNIETDIYLADWNGPKGKGAGFARNYDIVNQSDIVIAFTNGSKGTEHSLNYAKKQKKEIYKVSFLKEDKEPEIKVRFVENITPTFIKSHKEDIIVFGDNMEQKGKGGQAKPCRDFQINNKGLKNEQGNCFGIATKRLPSMKEEAFFSDQEEEIELVTNQLRELYVYGKKGKTIWLPLDGIGTGLADLENKSPLIRKKIDEILKEHFILMKKNEKIEITNQNHKKSFKNKLTR
jgi:hypothetical protein